MKNTLNYENSETLATGFARPKLMYLPFDIIQITEFLLSSSYEYFGIPKEVLAIEKEEFTIDNNFIENAG